MENQPRGCLRPSGPCHQVTPNSSKIEADPADPAACSPPMMRPSHDETLCSMRLNSGDLTCGDVAGVTLMTQCIYLMPVVFSIV